MLHMRAPFMEFEHVGDIGGIKVLPTGSSCGNTMLKAVWMRVIEQ